MKTKFNILFFLSICISVSSCYNEPSEFVPSLYVEAYINPSSDFEVKVMHTAHALEEKVDEGYVGNAKVTVKDFNTVETFTFEYVGNGIYKSIGASPTTGGRYQLQVEAEGYETCISATYVPLMGDITLHNLDIEITDTGENVIISFEPDIPAGLDNYLAWKFLYTGSTVAGGGNNQEGQYGETFAGSNGGTSKDYNFIPKQEAVSDGSTEARIITISAPRTSLPNYSPEQAFDGSELSINVVAVSEQLYTYMLNEKNETYPISSITGNGSANYSNIVDGYGIFGGFNEKAFALKE